MSGVACGMSVWACLPMFNYAEQKGGCWVSSRAPSYFFETGSFTEQDITIFGRTAWHQALAFLCSSRDYRHVLSLLCFSWMLGV